MFNYTVLNVVIGLVFIFLVYSLFTSAVQEALATLIQRRPKTLYKGIRTMLSNTPPRNLPFWLILLDTIGITRLYKWLKKKVNMLADLKLGLTTRNRSLLLERDQLKQSEKDSSIIRLYELFYKHPIIKNYGQNDYFDRPSYLPDKNFSTVLVEVIKELDPDNKPRTATFALIRNTLEFHKDRIDKEVYDILNYHFNEAAGDLDVFKYRLEVWYNDTMDRVSGWYKRNSSFFLFGIGLMLAIGLNIDTIEISTYLSTNKVAADKLAGVAVAAAGNPHLSKGDSITTAIMKEIQQNKDSINTLVGLGWGEFGRKDTAFIHSLKTHPAGWVKRKINQAARFLGGQGTYLFAKEGVHRSMQAATDSIPPRVLSTYSNYIAYRYIRHAITWKKLFGFFITAMAITMGAPFWFDLLGRLVSLRSAGKAITSNPTPQKKSDNKDQLDG